MGSCSLRTRSSIRSRFRAQTCGQGTLDRSTECKRSRGVCGLFPYKKVTRKKVKLPRRSDKGSYDDQVSLKEHHFITEKY